VEPLIGKNHGEEEELHYNSHITGITGSRGCIRIWIRIRIPLHWRRRSIYAWLSYWHWSRWVRARSS